MSISTQPRATLKRKRSTGVIYLVRWHKPPGTHKGYTERVYRSLEGAEKCAAWVRSTGRPVVILRARLGAWTVVE